MPVLDIPALEQRIAQAMAERAIPGAAVALADDQTTLYARGFGVTNVDESGVPVTPDTLFRIASTTKPLVGTAIMRLVEADILDLSAPLKTYVPWLRFSQPGAEERITLRHLLSHTSGLCTFRGDFSSRDPSGLETFARDYLPTYPLLTAPGVVWLYSNAGIALAAYIAQVATRMPFAELMRAWVFDPLAMAHTTFDPLVAMTYPLAQSHVRQEDGSLRVEHSCAYNTACEPASGAFSTVQDLAHLARMYLARGRFAGQRLLLPETIQRMWNPVVKLWTGHDEGYGLTFATETYKGLPLIRHNGGGLASYASGFYLIPPRGLAVMVLANGGPAGPLLRAVLDQVCGLPDTPLHPPATPALAADRAAWPRYAGTYLGVYTGLVTVRAVDDELRLTRNGAEFILRQIAPEHFLGRAVAGEGEIAVGFVADEHPQQGQSAYVVVDDSPCERVAGLPAYIPDPADWAAYPGTYLLPVASLMPSASLPVTITLEGGQLYLTHDGTTSLCIPLDAAHFACVEGLVAFHQTPEGPQLELWRTMTATRAVS